MERNFDLPSQPTMSRRMASKRVQELLRRMGEREMGMRQLGIDPIKRLDGKPPPVGGYSKDRHARWGRGVRGQAKGYKLHAIWGEGPLPLMWRVRPMNVPEPTVAGEMLGQLCGSGTILGDSAFDSNDLYDLAANRNHKLICPRKKPGLSPPPPLAPPSAVAAVDGAG
jgi:hypothetical protein